MHYFAYLLPAIALFAHWIWCNFYGGYPCVDYVVYAGVLCVMEGLVGLAHFIARRAGMDTEFLSGYVTEVRHYREWTELQVYYETVRDSRGNTRQERRERLVYHPQYWTWTLNTGHVENISGDTFWYLVNMWGGSTSYFSTFHPNCVAGGGGELCPWDGISAHTQTQTYPHRYSNPLDQSNSIFRYETISDQEAQELGLYDYPKIQGYEQMPIVGLDIATDEDQRCFQLLNATVGSTHEVHFFVLLYDASKGLTIGEKQRAYWHGGNKNEFTICLGVERGAPALETSQDSESGTQSQNPASQPQEPETYPILKWCNAFSWMDEPRMELALESWARDHSDQPLDLQAFGQWLLENIDLWKRKEWKDFKYIANPMNWWQLLIVYGMTVVACIGAWMVLIKVGFD